MRFVADASIAAAWVLPDEDTALADLAFDRLGEDTAVVPNLFWHELRNVLLKAERRGRISKEHANASMARVRRLAIRCPADADDDHVMALARRPPTDSLRRELPGARDYRGVSTRKPRRPAQRSSNGRRRRSAGLDASARRRCANAASLAATCFAASISIPPGTTNVRASAGPNVAHRHRAAC